MNAYPTRYHAVAIDMAAGPHGLCDRELAVQTVTSVRIARSVIASLVRDGIVTRDADCPHIYRRSNSKVSR